MRGTTQMMGRALLGALVLALIATAGWSQSLTWLGTLGGNVVAMLMMFQPTVPWWSAGRMGVPFAGRRRVGCNLGTLGRNGSLAWGVSADGAVVVVGALNAAGYARAFRERRWAACKTSARWAALGAMLMMFRRRLRGGRRC
jgi:uncharacterized membrane protein